MCSVNPSTPLGESPLRGCERPQKADLGLTGGASTQRQHAEADPPRATGAVLAAPDGNQKRIRGRVQQADR
jgi:hypothetical protein